MCIFKLCSVFTPHWLIGHGWWATAPGLDQSRPEADDQWGGGEQMLGFGTCDVLLFCDDPNKWLPWNIKANITLNVALSMLIFEGLNLISERR